MTDRFWGKVDVKDGGCWLWTGKTDACGYGRLTVNRKNMMAHRFAYEALVDGIPSGLQLDHLCRVRNCVNPLHLEAVTPRENTLRGMGISGVNARKAHCPKGHPYDAENTYRTPLGARACRRCKNAKRRAQFRRLSGGRAAIIQSNIARGLARTHCRQGHEYTAANTYMQPGGRVCRECKQMRERRNRAAKRAA